MIQSSHKARSCYLFPILLTAFIVLAAVLSVTGCRPKAVPGSAKVAKVDTDYVYEANVSEFVDKYRESRRTRISTFVGFSPDEILAAREHAIDAEVRKQVKRLPGVDVSQREITQVADKQMEEQGKELYRQLAEDGADFAQLAREFSSGINARNGGQVQPFGTVETPEEYQRRAYTMKVGDVSEPFSSWDGWRIIRLDDVSDDPIAGKSYRVSMILIKPDTQRAEDTIVDGFARQHTIEVLDPKYNARRALAKGEFNETLAQADDAIRRDPDDDLAHYLRARALWKLNRADEALQELLTAAQVGKISDALIPYYHFFRGQYLEELKRPDEALQAYHDCYDNWRQDINLGYLLRDTFVRLKDDEYVEKIQHDIDDIIAQDAVAIGLEQRGSGGSGSIVSDQGTVEGTSAEYEPGYRGK